MKAGVEIGVTILLIILCNIVVVSLAYFSGELLDAFTLQTFIIGFCFGQLITVARFIVLVNRIIKVCARYFEQGFDYVLPISEKERVRKAKLQGEFIGDYHRNLG